MGVPKFFRWMSERYPCLSEQVLEHQIPEFDNLYLDMNGIIHPCSHPNDGDAHFRITEKEIFTNIFHYIEVLLRLIRPKKVFYMAVDGVAPRAKMNQQRGRRFRTAREMAVLEEEAKRKGEKLPSEKRFDSNCITPGTGFMCRLNEQLQYFIKMKISTDPLWQGIRVILSGHNVPGEGEHKVMEFIRFEKSRADYSPNTRHCLYGLDADLMVLGLCTHEPHFSLLREEVLFTKAKSKRTTVPEEITFYLLHLSMMRDYLDHEFGELKDKLKFPYDLECIIDDWVLMGFLVGNDFVPHLPHLHINKNALPLLYGVYKTVLPTLDGYINECGSLHPQRFEALMKELSGWEVDMLQDDIADQKWLAGKRDIRLQNGEKPKLKTMKDFVRFDGEMDGLDAFPAMSLEPEKKSPFSVIESNLDDELLDSDDNQSVAELEYRQVRRHYYKTKMNIDISPDEARRMAVEYVRAVQWILHYYYDGLCSWGWYYPMHYSPMIGDVRDFCEVGGLLDYKMGSPFMPYEQLMAVLPPASAESMPESLRPLMFSEQSPIIDFYPMDFETDMNGKQQEWEAVVLLPFIDEVRLLEAITPLYNELQPIERARNQHGPAHLFQYTPNDQGRVDAPEYFPPLKTSYVTVGERPRDEYIAAQCDLVKGLLPQARVNVFRAGFPTLKNLEHTSVLCQRGVKVFQQPSRGDNMILTVTHDTEEPDISQVAKAIFERDIYVDWPHLIEARVTAITDRSCSYRLGQPGRPAERSTVSADARSMFVSHQADIKCRYLNKRGIETGSVNVVVYARRLMGRRYVFTAGGRATLEKIWSPNPWPYALQTCLWNIDVDDSDVSGHVPIQKLMSVGSTCFLLSPQLYGSKAEILDFTADGSVRVEAETDVHELDFNRARQGQSSSDAFYFPGYVVAKKVGISSHMVSRMTGCIFLLTKPKSAAPDSGPLGGLPEQSSRDESYNIAIDVKHNKRCEEVPGWSRNRNDSWFYSGRLVDTLREYTSRFPEVFDYCGCNTDGFKFYDTAIWPDEKIRQTRVTELKTWLQSLEYNKSARWPANSEVLDPEVVKVIEDTVDSHRFQTKKSVHSLSPQHIYTCRLVTGNAPPDLDAQYQPFDRVVCVREGLGVPIGLVGTVTGIRANEDPQAVLYEVVFDEAFTGGLALRCSSERGYKISAVSLINISHGRRRHPASRPPLLSAHLRAGRAPDPLMVIPPTGLAPAFGRHQAGSSLTSILSSGNTAAPRAAPFMDIWSDLKRQSLPLPPVPISGALSQPHLLQHSPTHRRTTAGASDHHRPPPVAATSRYPAPPHSSSTHSLLPGRSTSAPSVRPPQASEPIGVSTGSNACERLLDHLQNSDQGVPRYLYQRLGNDHIQASVCLPNGTTHISGPAPSREQAALLAAEAALTALGVTRSRQRLHEPTGVAQPAVNPSTALLQMLRSEVHATRPMPPPPLLPPPGHRTLHGFPAAAPPAHDITDSLKQLLAGPRAAAPAAASVVAAVRPHELPPPRISNTLSAPAGSGGPANGRNPQAAAGRPSREFRRHRPAKNRLACEFGGKKST